MPHKGFVSSSPGRCIARKRVRQQSRRTLRTDTAKTLNDGNRGDFLHDSGSFDEFGELLSVQQPWEIAEIGFERVCGVENDEIVGEVLEEREKEEQSEGGVATNEHLIDQSDGERRRPVDLLAQQLGIEKSAENPGGGDPT